jgi:hypothetical protein
LRSGQAVRYFPRNPIISITTEEAARRVIAILRGYLKAASLRYPLQLGVTAGYDSRILFLASKGLECQYYVSRNRAKYNDIDIAIGRKLAALHGQTLEVRQSLSEITDAARATQDQSIDFPRYQPLPSTPSGRMTITGNLSEIARNYFGDVGYRTGGDLAQTIRLGGLDHAEEAFDEWLQSGLPVFQAYGYDYRDMFYWEERTGNWAAKGKTEGALRGNVFSPFSSHILLETLLSTNRADRDKHFNTLYDTILKILSPNALDVPINPNPRIRVIKALKRLGVYRLYRQVGLRTGLLKS